ncbi:MAG TPA: glycosyltransferase [Fimbriimonadaceae bacterium]|jgi:glycosyltransferase involved in cell wall biosynthesis
MSLSIPVLYCVHDDHWFLRESIRSFSSAGPVVVFVSRIGWDGTSGDWNKCVRIARDAGAEIVVGDWHDESDHRRSAQAELKSRGYDRLFIPDSDEIIEPGLLKVILSIAEGDIAEIVHVHMDTYFKSPAFVIRPREKLTPALFIDLRVAEHVWIREYQGGRRLILTPDHGVLHHLSYAGPDERIRRKVETSSHRPEWIDQWYAKIWKGFDSDKLLRDLHPTHPASYHMAERIDVPPLIKRCWNKYPVAEEPTVLSGWPMISIVIPLYRGAEWIIKCLESLKVSSDLIHEVIVVDDCSPDDAWKPVENFISASSRKGKRRSSASGKSLNLKLIRNEANLGFAGACNVGYRASEGSVIVFLNSDTQVPRSGLIRLIETLMSSGSIGAAGPMSNNAGYHQHVNPTYTDISRMSLFALEFATRELPDEEVAMLVGFCLAVKRQALEEAGGGFDERFEIGFFEDNDICMRIAMAGFKLKVSSRAFVHHEGTKSISGIGIHPEVLLARNMAVYEQKWTELLGSGYASHLPGQVAGPILFRPERHPDEIRRRLKRLGKKANISLTMIVKDEERCLGDCLRSVRDIFTQVVVVDTGSSDRTKEIAKEYGAEVHEFAWTDSFADARNEALRHAKGDWVMFMDADDVLPLKSAEEFLHAVIEAPKSVDGFVIGVQFISAGDRTRVDHLKLFRRYPDLEWEGAIHEQILPSLNRHKGIHPFLKEPVVHANYDVSVEGQARKRQRDEPLLLKDHAERPDHPYPMFNLGMTRHFERRFEEAIKWLEMSINASDPAASHLRKAFVLLGNSWFELGNVDRALEEYRRGIALVGEDPELRYRIGIVLSDQGKHEAALHEFLAISDDLAGRFSSVDVSILDARRSHNIANCYLALDKYAESREWFIKAVEAGFAPSAQELFEAALNRMDIRTAFEAAERLAAIAGPIEPWAIMRVRISESRMEPAEPFLEEMCKVHPHQTGPRIVLARRLCEQNRFFEAVPHLQMLEQMGIGEAAYLLSIGALHSGNIDEALRYARRAVECDPLSEAAKQQLEAIEQVAKS